MRPHRIAASLVIVGVLGGKHKMALETKSTPIPPPSPSNASSSLFLPTVCLHSWWLIKAENDFHGKRLAVAGFTSREREAVRVFVSAPIIKRHDLFSLETADGVYLIIKGFINELRTRENGIPSEVFTHFLFGFPPDWECYTVNCFKEEVTTGIDTGNFLTSKGSPIESENLRNAVEKSSPIFMHSLSQEETSGGYEKSFLEDKFVSEEMGDANAACGNALNRRGRLHNIKSCQHKKPASGSSTSGAMENPDGEELKSPVTPIKSWGEINESSEQFVGESVSRKSRTLSPNTESQSCTEKVVVLGLSRTEKTKSERKMTKCTSADSKRKMAKSISADSTEESISMKRNNKKINFDTNVSPITNGRKEKLPTVFPESLNFRRSRSGRLLLPPLEFWRNQMPVYDADHNITEIQEGASFISPSRVLPDLMIFAGSGAQSQKKRRQ